ncbi:MAG: autotransporter-associated beta strand repeat-containing protein [Kiritimatiellae bacterium]|nr:autotransporter-associated beta strand repeat-containing protein [Kiritimatiellia bacterium]
MRNRTFGVWPLTCACAAGLLSVTHLAFADDSHAGYGLVEAIHAGNTVIPEAYPFRLDTGIISGNHSGRNGNAVDRSGPNCWAPEAVYQCETWHSDWSTHPIIINNLVPGSAYLVECHNEEAAFGAGDTRIFTIKVNGEVAVDSLDMAATYGQFVACCIQKTTVANADGTIVIDLVNVKENPRIAGVAIWGMYAPTAIDQFSATKNASAMTFAWSTAKDTLRYYIQKAEAETGPWSDLGEYVRTETGVSIEGCYDPSRLQCYRVVASNGVGIVTSEVVTFTPDDVTYTDIATRGETLADDAASNLRISTVAPESQPLNALGADTVSVGMLMQGASAASTLALGANQTFKAGTVGILNGGAALTIGDTAGQGTLSALTDEGLSARVDPANETLTINATLTDMILTKYGLGNLVLALPPTYNGTLAIAAGTVTTVVSEGTEASIVPVLRGTGTFAKTGKGTLKLNTISHPDMTGDVVVGEGKMVIEDTPSAPFGGDSESALRVASGATLDMVGGGDNNLRFGTRRIVFEGTGTDGSGAVQNTSGQSQYNVFAAGELSGDATVNTVKRFDFRKYNGVGFFKMNNHALTKVGGDTFGLTEIAVTSGGPNAAFQVHAGTFTAEVSTTFDTETPGTIILANNGAFDFYNLAAPVTWPFIIDATGGKFSSRSGDSDTQNRISGTVTVNGPLALSANDNTRYTIEGIITGDGNLIRKEGGRTGRVDLVNPDNDYTGGTEVNYGTLYAKMPAALPGYDQAGNVVISGSGKLWIPAGDGTTGWNSDQISTLFANASAPSDGGGAIVIDTTGGDYAMDQDVERALGIGKSGEGTMLATGAFKAGGMLFVDQGELVVSNHAENVISSAYADDTGILRIADSTILTGDGAVEIGGHNPNHASLILESGSVWISRLSTWQTAGPEMKIGTSGNGTGLLIVNDGAIISNRISVATGNGAQGAIHQFGGIVDNHCGHSSDGRIGSADNGYGYWEISGGEGTAEGYFQLGRAPSSIGILSVKAAGTFIQTNSLDGFLGMSRGGTGVVYQAGGTFRSSPRLYVGDSNEYNGTGGHAVFTIDGNEAVAEMSQDIVMANRKDILAQVNINGGILSATEIIRDGNGVDTGLATVSFGGGTFKSRKSGSIFGTNYKPDALHITEGGATFDTAGFNSTLNLPLTTPAGQGVKAIRYTATGLIGPPHVTIRGNGQGATAVADYDARTGNVKGIIITNPGWNYTEKPTVTLNGGGLSGVVTIDASAIRMGATTGGSLTKKGEGSLALSGENVYSGETVVEGGTLIIPSNASIPADGDLVLDGGSLTFDATETVKQRTITLREGTLTASSLHFDTIVKEGDGDAELRGTFAYAKTDKEKQYANPGLNMQFTMDDNSATYSEVVTSLDYADTPLTEGVALAEGIVNKDVTCTYTGYIWNREDHNVTWTFAENFDDLVDLKIDDDPVLDNGGWNTITKANYTLTPGPHTFSLRLHQGGGGSGSVNSGWWTDTTKGVVVDFQGRNAEDISYYERMIEDGTGKLFTTEGFDLEPEPGFGEGSQIIVREGTLKMSGNGAQPGLAYGFVFGNYDNTAPCPMTFIDGQLSYVHTAQGDTAILPTGDENKNVNCIYTGYIWNREDHDVTWTFAEHFDDNVYLTIDGQVILNNGSWDAPTHGNATLSPGPHKFDLHLYQGGGGSGASGANVAWWTDKSIGMLIDFQGRNEEVFSNYVKLADPGDGSLFTTIAVESGTPTLAADTTLAIQAGGALDLDGSTVAVNNLLSAGGEVDNGTLKVTGSWDVDCAELVAGKTLAIEGGLDLSDLPVMNLVGDTSLLQAGQRYPIATVTGTITGDFSEVNNLPANPWAVVVTESKVTLTYQSGTFIILR